MLQFLLLQARNQDDPMAAHEHACFVEKLGVESAQVQRHSLLEGIPSASQLEAVDALLIGGSGDYSVLDKHPWVTNFLTFLRQEVLEGGKPTFASCFGFQGLVLAGGGEVINDPAAREVGTYAIHLSEAGAKDPLLGTLTPTFKAQLGHLDRASRLPLGMTNLAHSDLVPCQALRVDNKPVMATQFHPELSCADNRLRYETYLAHYASKGASDDHEEAMCFEESPQASGLLARWVAEIFPANI